MIKILVIEDEVDLLDEIIEGLQLEDFEVIGASNGTDGIDLAQKHHPDLIVCDIMMPDMSGYEVLLTLKQDPVVSLIPFIFLTAKTSREDIRGGMTIGADDYLTKPIRYVELIEAIKAQLQKRTQMKDIYEGRLDDLRQVIIGSLPHEIRTPLTGIIGYAEILEAGYDRISLPQIRTTARAISESAQRLNRIMENYIQYAHIEIIASDPIRSQKVRETDPIEAQKIIENTAVVQAEQYQRENDLRLNVGETTLRLHSDNLEKIVRELTDNALKFSQPGTPVDVVCHEDNGYQVLVFRDEGRGMTPEQIDSIGAYMQFERKVYEQQGIGMGLIIAKRMTELYGGEFLLESTPDEYTSVTLRFPTI